MSTLKLSNAATPAGQFELSLHPRRVLMILLSCVVGLVMVSTLAKAIMMWLPGEDYGAVHELCKRVYLDFENNIPAWFSTLGLFASSMLLGVIGLVHRKFVRPGTFYWLGLSLIFLGLAIDEATYIHEILIVSLRDHLQLSGILYFAWVVPGMLFVALLGLAYIPFLIRLNRELRNGLITAGLFYVGGALGMELAGGYFAESQGFDSLSYVFVMSLEETLEMLGIVTLLYVLLKHLADLLPNSLEVRFV